jgi:arylsulfatase A-like enzyme
MASETIDTAVSLGAHGVTTADALDRSTSTLRERVADLLIRAVWFGLLTGFAEVSLVAAQKFLLRRFEPQALRSFVFLLQGFNPHVVWMTPVADLLLFSLVGLVLMIGALVWPKLIAPRIATTVFAFLAFSSLLLMVRPIGRYAAFLVAAGLGVQSARLLVRWNVFRSPFLWRTTKWMLALVAALLIGVFGWQGLAERRALAKLPPAAPNAPNVLLITLDTVRARSLSLYGYNRPTTPQLERISKNGVRFDRALVTAPWTLPSHASMFTGRLPHETSADWFKPLDATHPTLAEVLGRHGYATAGFVANLDYCNSATGLSRGFVHYEEYPISLGQIALSSTLGEWILDACIRPLTGYQDLLNRKLAAELNRDFLTWISRNDQRPFFAFLNYFDAHEPFLPPSPFATTFGPNGRPKKNLIMAPEQNRNWTEKEIQLERDAYDGSIAYLDQELGLLFDELQRRGKLANTLVIITSDHGEEFSEHQIMGHGYDVYLPTLHVPLLIQLPSRVPAGAKVSDVVSLRDLPATIMDLLKLDDKTSFPGNSLARYWDGSRNAKPGADDALLSELDFAPNLPASYPLSRGNMKSLVFGAYHYIRNGDGSEQLYNLEKDPNETSELSRSESERQVLDRFRVSLKTMVPHE